MSRLLLLLAAVALALPASAQSPTEPDPGFYLNVQDLNISGDRFADFDVLGTTVEAGRRLGNGVEVGLLGSYARYGRGRSASNYSWQAGLTAGLTRPSAYGTTFRLRGVGLLGAAETQFSGDQIESSYLQGDLSATFGREVPVVGSVRVEPMVGAYANVVNPMRRAGTGRFADPPPGDVNGEVGLQFALPVRFRVLGMDAALTPGLRVTGFTEGGLLPRRSYLAVPGTGFRLDF